MFKSVNSQSTTAIIISFTLACKDLSTITKSPSFIHSSIIESHFTLSKIVEFSF